MVRGLGVAGLSLALTAATGCAVHREMASTGSASGADSKLQALCSAENVAAVTASIKVTAVTATQVENGPFKSATRFVAAKDNVPAYCQVTGTFVTNPKTGKTANYLATFPANWNGKFLQLGCSGHCGQFFVSDPATASVTVTSQGHPNQIIEKGYATFATDEGHMGQDRTSWAVRADGSLDQDFLDDFFYRADLVLADMGKEFTKAFYSRLNGRSAQINRSYFSGCSGGGRDAFVAAAYFPEKYDGIIAGSGYNLIGVSFLGAAIELAANRPGAALSRPQLALFDQVVKNQCDAVDGVKDGVIQNPAACNFLPERDLPRCAAGQSGDACFSPSQIETVSTAISAVTDEKGNLVQPGYSVSELQAGTRGSAGGRTPVLKVFVRKNDPNFKVESIYNFGAGSGPIGGYRATVQSSEVSRAIDVLKAGSGHYVESPNKLLASKTKMLIWHNLSDEALPPYMSVNYYKQLAKLKGGYKALQDHARLFLLPGTAHCSIVSIAPNGFDPLSAMENWVEKSQAPTSLMARVRDTQFSPGAPKAAALAYPNWTMPLCAFPAMARYKGSGDLKNGANWSCPANDTRMLQVGETGRRAGVIE